MNTPERYAPPRAAVADVATADALLQARPRSVAAAVALLALSLVIAIVSALLDPPITDEPLAMTAMVWGVTLAIAAIELWLLRDIWRRRNWARWWMLVLIAIGLGATAVDFATLMTQTPLVAWLALTSAAASAVAALLLLVSPSSRWFNTR